MQVVPLLPRCDGTIRWRWGFRGGVSGVAVGDARTATAKVRVVTHHTFSPERRMQTHIPLVNSATLSTWNDSRFELLLQLLGLPKQAGWANTKAYTMLMEAPMVTKARLDEPPLSLCSLPTAVSFVRGNGHVWGLLVFPRMPNVRTFGVRARTAW